MECFKRKLPKEFVRILELRNSLKVFNLSDNLREDSIFDLRPEQLSIDNFVKLTNMINSQ